MKRPDAAIICGSKQKTFCMSYVQALSICPLQCFPGVRHHVNSVVNPPEHSCGPSVGPQALWPWGDGALLASDVPTYEQVSAIAYGRQGHSRIGSISTGRRSLSHHRQV
jgi:hypothetical protein